MANCLITHILQNKETHTRIFIHETDKNITFAIVSTFMMSTPHFHLGDLMIRHLITDSCIGKHDSTGLTLHLLGV